ncbi:MAG: holo-ACP synthase [Streptosporangiaceae bacterium]
MTGTRRRSDGPAGSASGVSRGTLDDVILGIGVDVADIRRLEAALARTPHLAARLFAESERELPMRALAGSFAAKEAVAKALGAPPGLRWTDAIVRRDSRGRPALETRGTVAAVAASLGVTAWHVSISHDAGICVAMVVAEGRGQPAPDRTEASRATER